MTTIGASKRAHPGVGRTKEERLSTQEWLDAGLRILGRTGPGGLRIDQVCTALAVTKGSFYWHFRDRRDFCDRLFEHWRQRGTTALVDLVEGAYDDPVARIWHVLEFVTLGDYDVPAEVAMRQWAQSDATVRAALAEVDGERLDFFARQFEALGLTGDQPRLRAIAVYSLTLSCGYMLTGETPKALETRLRASLDLLLADTHSRRR